MARIETRGLGKRFGDVEALRDLSLEVGDGQIAALLGPSGCGKSTTLFILAGLYQPSAGEVLFDGADMAGVPPRQRNVGLVFQSYALYPHMTVRENIGFPLVLQGAARRDIERRVADIAGLAGLEELLDRKPSQLSGGQQQRVAAARAIVKRPRLLLMDEPLSNLDPELRARMRREIKRLQRETGITTIIVTHDQEEAMSLADRIYVMQGGRVQQGGGHRELYERPANRFVAGFIGAPAMNFLAELALVRADGRAWLESRGQRIMPAGGELAGLEPRLPGAVLGVRPEHVTVAMGGADSAPAGVPARIIDIVPEGREVVVGLQLDGGVELRSIVPGHLDLQLGQAVGIAIDERFVHLFEGQGEGESGAGAALHHGAHGSPAP
ncbi:MAG TPA: ABC transporter ATP-binding protein [Kofleriaceae bacterium]|nr:ABC transporter ATP-binding protein [Kofleriaceae bacterium]